MASGFLKGTRLTGPVLGTDQSRAEERAWFAHLPTSFEPSVTQNFNDFLKPSDYNESSDWSVVESGSGSRGYSETDNGALSLTTGGTTNNFEAIFLKDNYPKIGLDRKVWFRTRLKLSTTTSVTLLAGLSAGNPNNRISFDVATGSSLNVQCTCANDSVLTTSTDGTVDWTVYNDFAWVYDGKSKVDFYINDHRVATITTNIPTSADNMRVSFQIITNSGAAKTVTIDYYFVAVERKSGQSQ